MLLGVDDVRWGSPFLADCPAFGGLVQSVFHNLFFGPGQANCPENIFWLEWSPVSLIHGRRVVVPSLNQYGYQNIAVH